MGNLDDEEYEKAINEIAKYYPFSAETIKSFLESQINYKITNDFLTEEVIKKDTKIKELEGQVKVLDEAYTEAIKEIKKLIENETIDIGGFECIAVEDLEELFAR